MFIVFDSPEIHPRISPEERDFIVKSLKKSGDCKESQRNDAGDSELSIINPILSEKTNSSSDIPNSGAEQTTPKSPPWRHILTSPRVAVICVSHMANNWCFYTLLTSGPKFLRDVYKFDLGANGAISTLPYVLSMIAMVNIH